MASIGDFFVQYRATADKFLADLNKMSQDAKQFDRTIAPLRERATDIGKAFTAVGGAVTGAFILMAKQAANYGDAIRDASIRTGVSTQALSGFKLAAEQTGTSFESVTQSLRLMSAGALNGNKAFAALGISTKDASGKLRPMESLVGDVADKFQGMENNTLKAALAQKLFGRNGAAMIEFLNQGRAGIEEFNKQAEELGLLVGPEFAKASDDFNDSLNLMKQAQLGLSVTIGNMLLPALTKTVGLVTQGIVEFRKFTAAHPELTRAIFLLAGALTGAGGLVLGLAGLLVILPKIQAALTLLITPLGLATAGVIAFGAALVVFPKFRGFVVDQLQNMTGAVYLFGSAVASLAVGVDQILRGRFRQAWATLSTAATRALEDAQAGVDAFSDVIGGMPDIMGAFSGSVAATGPPLSGMAMDLDLGADTADKLRDKLATLANFLRGSEGNLEAPIKRFAAAFDLLNSKIDIVAPKLKEIFLAPDLLDISTALENNAKFTERQLADQNALNEARAKDAAILAESRRALERATEDVKRSAGHIFDLMFERGENVFSKLKNLLKGGALSLGRAIFEDIAGALLGPIKLAFDNFFKGLLDKTVGGFVKGLGEKLGGVLGGGATSAIGSAASAGGSAAGAAGSIAGGISSSIAGGLISGGLAAAGAIIGSLMQKGNLKRTEENTREGRDWLELQTVAWNPLFHKMEFHLASIAQSVTGGISGAGRIGPSSLNPPVSSSQLTINVSAPSTFAPVMDFAGQELTPVTIREVIMPELTFAYETNIRGHGDRIAQIIGQRLGFITTPTPVGI